MGFHGGFSDPIKSYTGGHSAPQDRGFQARGEQPTTLQKDGDRFQARGESHRDKANAAKAHAGAQAHANDVKGSGGGKGGNPNHDEHGRFT